MSLNSYASTIRSIMYAKIFTRPDVSYALSVMSRYHSDLGRYQSRGMTCASLDGLTMFSLVTL